LAALTGVDAVAVPPRAPAALAADYRRRQLAGFLRARRRAFRGGHVTPLPTARRRTPGLRREELAAAAGISATWYTYLEQGRSVNPSEQVLRALAVALRLSPREAKYLLDLGLPHHLVPPDRTVSPPTRTLLRHLEPDAALVLGPAMDVLHANSVVDGFLPGLLPGSPQPNLLDWALTSPATEDVFVAREPLARALLASFRRRSVTFPTDEAVSRVLSRVVLSDPRGSRWWDEHDVDGLDAGAFTTRRGEELVPVQYATLDVVGSTAQTLLVFFLT
jgi:transcriptional regulator with XRE-family HTH domain